ncbi:MAG: PD-(D/E)XK nuclease family protein, partial [Patescibacteria group bacterium]
AILVQTNAELLPLYDVLRARKIPVELSGKVDLLSHPLVLQAVTILHAVEKPSENYRFLNALACGCFDLPAIDLANLAKASRDEKKSLQDLLIDLQNGTKEIPFMEREKLLLVGKTILDLHLRTDSRTIVETTERVLRECHLLPEQQDDGSIDVHACAVAQIFFDYVQARAYELPGYALEMLLSDLEFYGNPEYRDVRLTYTLPHLTEEGVQLMTAHKSKGLEFATVIIPNFREGHWDRRRNPSSLSMPEDLLFGWRKEEKEFEQSQDERRVAYVAMTRAREELIFTCPQVITTGGNEKAVSPSGFFAEAGELPEEHREIEAPAQAVTLLHPALRKYPEETRSFLKEQIEHFSLSPTALHDFLENPQQFLERHLLRFPTARNPSYAYGNAVHHVLAEWGISVQRGEPLPEKILLAKFREHLSEREVLTDAERKRLEKLGEEALSRYYSSSLLGKQPIIHKVECELRAHVEDTPIKGKLDRIDLFGQNDARAIVYDYKTGKPATPAQIEERGYGRQLLFYDVLLRQALPMLRPERYVLSFVGEEGESPIEQEFTFMEKDRRD